MFEGRQPGPLQQPLVNPDGPADLALLTVEIAENCLDLDTVEARMADGSCDSSETLNLDCEAFALDRGDCDSD